MFGTLADSPMEDPVLKSSNGVIWDMLGNPTSGNQVIALNPANLAKVKYLTTKTYPYLAPVVREYLNEQLLEARYYWEFETWLDQIQATREWYENPDSRPLLSQRKKAIRP